MSNLELIKIESNSSFRFGNKQKENSFEWIEKIRPFLVFLILLFLVFSFVNIDFVSAKYFFKSHFSKTSARKLDMPKEWMQKYNVVLTNKLDAMDDFDADGLIFKDEIHYGTDPFGADTDGDGENDGNEIKNGTNPLGTGELDNNHNSIPDLWEIKYGILESNNPDTDGDGLKNIDEYLHGTNPLKSDTDEDTYDDAIEIKNGYDPDAKGNPKSRVLILSNKIDLVAPMVWSTSEDENIMRKDLEKGVVHYPNSGIPGQNGNIIISGHSSNYVWAKGEYNSIFRNINNLSEGDSVTVRVVQENGKVFDHEYKILAKKVLDPSDDWIFEDFEDEKILTLSTCWPIGTDISRLVIRAKG